MSILVDGFFFFLIKGTSFVEPTAKSVFIDLLGPA